LRRRADTGTSHLTESMQCGVCKHRAPSACDMYLTLGDFSSQSASHRRTRLVAHCRHSVLLALDAASDMSRSLVFFRSFSASRHSYLVCILLGMRERERQRETACRRHSPCKTSSPNWRRNRHRGRRVILAEVECRAGIIERFCVAFVCRLVVCLCDAMTIQWHVAPGLGGRPLSRTSQVGQP